MNYTKRMSERNESRAFASDPSELTTCQDTPHSLVLVRNDVLSSAVLITGCLLDGRTSGPGGFGDLEFLDEAIRIISSTLTRAIASIRFVAIQKRHYTMLKAM